MAADQLSRKNPDGTKLGQSSTDLIGFYGKTARIAITTFASISVAETTANVKSRINKILNGLKNVGLIQ